MKAAEMIALWGTITMLLLGCSALETKQKAYLRTAQGRATQDDITQALGRPRMAKALVSAGSKWTYRFWEHDAGDRNHPAHSWCEEYTLIFDDQGILRRWVEQPCE